MNRTLCLIMLLCVVLLSSCTSYVGVHVNPNNPNYCSSYTPQYPCRIADDDFRVQLEIDELDEPGRYLAKGDLAILNKANFNAITHLRITIFMLKDNVVVDSLIHSIGSGEIGKDLPINREFKTDEEFDAIVVGYNYRVQG